MTGPKFELGTVVATPAAIERAERHDVSVRELLRRHLIGDWGDLAPADKRANDQALTTGARILSAYGSGDAKLWIITEAATDACPACHGYPGRECEPDKGEWLHGTHFRTDVGTRRLSTTILRPEDY